jgi:hypothetical protein
MRGFALFLLKLDLDYSWVSKADSGFLVPVDSLVESSILPVNKTQSEK